MQKKTWWTVLLILIIATFFRTYHLANLPPGLYPDEAMNGSNAQAALAGPEAGGFKVFYPDNNGREGLFMNIQAMFVKVFGNEAWALRLPSAIFGILTVLGLILFLKELFRDERLALWSGFFLAVSFWHINFSRIGFRAITSVFFLVWALYLFLKSLREDRALWAVLAGISFGLGFYSYIAYRITPLLFVLFIPFFRKTPGFWKLSAFFIAATFLAALPIGMYFLENPADFFGRTTQVSIFSLEHPFRELGLNTLKTAGMLNFQGDGNWRHNLSGSPQLFWPVGILFWLGAGYGIKEIIRNRQNERFPYLLLFGWIVLATLPVVISSEGIPHALRAILMIPPIYALAGAGGILLYRTAISRLAARKWLLVSFVAILIIQSFYSYFIAWGRNPNVQGAFAADYAAMAKEINSLPAKDQKIVVVEAGGVPVRVRTPEGERMVPMPAQTVMFLTDTFTAEGQSRLNLRYVLPGEAYTLSPEAKVFYIR